MSAVVARDERLRALAAAWRPDVALENLLELRDARPVAFSQLPIGEQRAATLYELAREVAREYGNRNGAGA